MPVSLLGKSIWQINDHRVFSTNSLLSYQIWQIIYIIHIYMYLTNMCTNSRKVWEGRNSEMKWRLSGQWDKGKPSGEMDHRWGYVQLHQALVLAQIMFELKIDYWIFQNRGHCWPWQEQFL